MQPDTSPPPNERADWIVKVNYQNRASALAMMFSIVTAHIYNQQAGAGIWALITGVLLIYPHLATWRLGGRGDRPIRIRPSKGTCCWTRFCWACAAQRWGFRCGLCS